MTNLEIVFGRLASGMSIERQMRAERPFYYRWYVLRRWLVCWRWTIVAPVRVWLFKITGDKYYRLLGPLK